MPSIKIDTLVFVMDRKAASKNLNKQTIKQKSGSTYHLKLFFQIFAIILTMARCRTRSDTVLFKIQDTQFKERDLLDLSKPIQVPSVRYVVERVFTVKKGIGVQPGCQDIAVKEASLELQELWVFLNLQPKSYSQIVRDITKLIKEVDRLRRYPSSKQGGPSFMKDVAALLAILENGFDIRTSDKHRIGELEEKYFVKMSENSEEEKLYKDNCVPLEEDKPPLQKGRCARLMWSSTKVDQDWLLAANER